jgi:hypothetical protein
VYVTPATFCHFGRHGRCFDNHSFCLKNHVIRAVEANVCGSMVAWSFQLLFCVDSAVQFGDFVVKTRFMDPGLVCLYANWWHHTGPCAFDAVRLHPYRWRHHLVVGISAI